jgi:hypothetical protein
MRLTKRVDDLEAKMGWNDPSAGKPWHRIVRSSGQSWRDAIADYGRERIGEHDNVIFYQVVVPRWEGGKIVPPLETDRAPHNWRELYQ